MKTRTMTTLGLMLSIGIIIALTAMMLPVTKHEKKMPGKGDSMMDMHKQCMMLCEKGCGDADPMISWLDEAVEAIEAGNTDEAKAKIDAVKTKLEAMQANMKKCMKKMPACNMTCPGCGMKIDMKDISGDQMRVCDGMKVGFCKSACAAKWDMMTDDEKTEKLKKCMPQKEKMHEHDSEHPR